MELTRAELHCLKQLVRNWHKGKWPSAHVDVNDLYGKLNLMWAAAAASQGHKP